MISIMSGKGGVGKTSLALALAYELSAAGNSVLLLDADFYNRGLSELMRGYKDRDRCPSDVLNAILPNISVSDRACAIVRIHDTLRALDIPALTANELSFLESRTTEQMKDRLQQLIVSTIRRIRADIVVIDCHGGRDVVSFASASISDHVIVVNVPEINTFFGTLNLLKDLSAEEIVGQDNSSSPSRAPKFHMVFNLARRGFRLRMLSYWYGRYFARYFDDVEFLSVFPFEPDVSIATASRRIPTQRLHYSSMAEKMRCIVYRLFKDEKRVTLADESVLVGKIMAPIIRGRRPILFILVNDRIALQALLIGLGILLGANVVLSAFFGSFWMLLPELALVRFGMNVAEAVVTGTFFWTVFTFVAHTMIDHDTVISGEFNNASRMRWDKVIVGVGGVLIGLLIYRLFESTAHGGIEGIAVLSFGVGGARDLMEVMWQCVMILERVTLAAFFSVFAWRSARNVWFRRWSGETVYRLIVVATMGGLVAWAFV